MNQQYLSGLLEKGHEEGCRHVVGGRLHELAAVDVVEIGPSHHTEDF